MYHHNHNYVSFLPPPYFFPLFLPPPTFFWAISPSSLICSSTLLSQFQEKILYFPSRNFQCLMLDLYPGIRLCTLLSIFLSIIGQLDAYGRLKTKENFSLLPLKLVAVALNRVVVTHKRFQILHSDFTWKLWIFWKTGCWGEVVACERWLQPDVRLYYTLSWHECEYTWALIKKKMFGRVKFRFGPFIFSLLCFRAGNNA